MASRTAVRLTPNCSASSRSAGNWSPAFSVPFKTDSSICFTICSYRRELRMVLYTNELHVSNSAPVIPLYQSSLIVAPQVAFLSRLKAGRHGVAGPRGGLAPTAARPPADEMFREQCWDRGADAPCWAGEADPTWRRRGRLCPS